MRTDPQWKKIGFSPHHGICVPLSSLRTQKSSGIGEFTDLIPLIDWCKSLHLDCIQLLPLNDSGSDPSPYNPLSSCALDPDYLSLSALGIGDAEAFQTLTAAPRVNKQEVKRLKLPRLRRLFEETFSSLSQTAAYQQFLACNPWLPSYALFKALKEQFGGTNWTDWPNSYTQPPRSAIDFYTFLQFHCFAQLEQVRAHATQQGVFLKGDIPILLSPDSADVWANRPLFRLDLVAGAPPDLYNPQGQKWGFPLFNWEAMEESGFVWWKQRLQVAERLFHIYRIDHVVGLFRIWAIPKGKKSKDGAFIPAEPKLWFSEGKKRLEMMIDSTSLLPIAEDLGTIPPELYPILKELGICGTKVIRWQRNWEGDGSFIPYADYEPLSLTTLSTPDMPTLEMWWKKYPAEAARFAAFKQWPYHPLLTQKQRLEILHDSHHTPSLFHINLLQEYLALFPELSWLNPEEDQINIPGTLLPTNWTYRFRPYLEEIVAHERLATVIKSLQLVH